ncbi:LTA synthase family protein [Cohnella zeiphila]|uniref:LTA synthase family protein n=1 Tax=Cohnella zeiphila TaxID=2761120 RepID=A0A7X0SMT5_9BACL|nr:LTA synthase family protein [Cohnella zeiphila]MBB6731759.1 LTA synthase family protein [Cohnella zeiphila]
MIALVSRQRLRGVIAKPFVFFSVLMILKIYLAWFVIFDEGHFWASLATGVPSVWFVFCLIETMFYKRKLGAYLIADLVMTSIYFAVIMYYKYFGVIVTYHALQQAGQVTEVKGSVMSLLHPYFLLIYVDIVALFFILIFNKKVRAWGRSLAVKERQRFVTGIGILMLAACVACIWPNKDSMNEILQAQSMGILNYEVYAAFAASKDDDVSAVSVNQQAIEKLKGETPSATPAYFGAAKGKNVIIIQMEAFQNFLLNKKLDGKELTPNMNKLLGSSLYFPHFFQQVGQGNTADAEFVVNTSFYVPQHGAASQEYVDRVLPSMPRTFAANGYQTATFHTNDITFWNRKELYAALGWDKHYDKTFFGDEDPVMFAASDEVLYSKTADELAKMQSTGQPFYVQLISMSGHHPFDIPERKYKMDLPDRYEGTLVGDYIRAQNYADYALGQFVDKLKANGVWDNSVVVIYGDHQGLPIYSLTSKEKDLMKEIYGRDYGVQDMMNIPLLIKLPGASPEGKELPQTGGQSDIFPTVANLAGISLEDHVHFGQDLLNDTHNVLPERYYLPSGSFINDSSVFVPGKSFEDGTISAIDGGKLGKDSVTKDQYNQALELLSMSDAYVRSLPERK